MFIKCSHCAVNFSAYAENHFCKDFQKKYGAKNWQKTLDSLLASLKQIRGFDGRKTLDVLRFAHECGIFKFDFAVAGLNQSPKSSGNRLIFFLDNTAASVDVLLVYDKHHVKSSSETEWIYDHLKRNFAPLWGRVCG